MDVGHITTTNKESSEYEVLAEAQIVGAVEHDGFCFRIWESADKTPGEERKLCLQVAGKAQDIDFDAEIERIKKASKGGKYTNLGPPQKIVVLSSLFLRRRFSLPTLVRWGDDPMIIRLGQYDPCSELRSGCSNLAHLKKSFQKWDRATEEFQHDYLRAARLYFFACNLMDKDLGASYLLFTIAIETLAANHKLKRNPTLRDVNPNLDKMIGALVKKKEVAKELRRAALEKERFIGRSFVEFALKNIEGSFWKNGTGPKRSQVKKKGIKQILKNIYNQRSLTLHAGEPFPIYIYQCPRDRSEISQSSSMTTEGKKWKKKDYIPYIHFMERLTNHILCAALRNHVNQLT